MADRLQTRIGWLRRSSTLRLTALLSLVFAGGFVVAIFVALTLGQNAIEQRVDTTLETMAQGIFIEDAAGDSDDLILRELDELQGLPSPMRRVAARDGGTVELAGNFRGADLWRVFVGEDGDGEPIFMAVPIEDTADVQEVLSGILWATAAVVVALVVGLGVWTGLLAQRRLATVNRTLNQLAAGDLSARTGHMRSKDDLDDIALNLDQTAGELERLVTQTRHLSASIAHDLRTPLARLRAQLEMLPDGDQRGAALEEASRLSEIFDTIMRVARIEAGQGRDGFEPVNLGELASDLAETFGPVVEDEGKTLALNLSDPQNVMADQGMLVQAIANLIQNAIVHGGDQITLTAAGTRISVLDNGVGVGPDQYEEVLKPMVRLDAARKTPGSGLGLALVKAVADRHGASLELTPNRPQGLCVTLNFTKK